MTNLHFTSILGLLVLSAAPSTALAGACPTCTASSECTSPDDGPAFCVVHDAPVGCGDLVTLCCPGQGCAVTGGRPSCEAAGTCTVIEDLTDAGLPDAGPVEDAGSSDVDGGPTSDGGGTDGGAGPMDSGSGVDAGGTSPGASGCGCRAGAADPGSAALTAIGGLALAIVARRRR